MTESMAGGEVEANGGLEVLARRKAEIALPSLWRLLQAGARWSDWKKLCGGIAAWACAPPSHRPKLPSQSIRPSPKESRSCRLKADPRCRPW